MPVNMLEVSDSLGKKSYNPNLGEEIEGNKIATLVAGSSPVTFQYEDISHIYYVTGPSGKLRTDPVWRIEKVSKTADKLSVLAGNTPYECGKFMFQADSITTVAGLVYNAGVNI